MSLDAPGNAEGQGPADASGKRKERKHGELRRCMEGEGKPRQRMGPTLKDEALDNHSSIRQVGKQGPHCGGG